MNMSNPDFKLKIVFKPRTHHWCVYLGLDEPVLYTAKFNVRYDSSTLMIGTGTSGTRKGAIRKARKCVKKYNRNKCEEQREGQRREQSRKKKVIRANKYNEKYIIKNKDTEFSLQWDGMKGWETK